MKFNRTLFEQRTDAALDGAVNDFRRAELVGISRMTLKRLHNNEVTLSVWRARAICTQLNVEFDDLFPRTPAGTLAVAA